MLSFCSPCAYSFTCISSLSFAFNSVTLEGVLSFRTVASTEPPSVYKTWSPVFQLHICKLCRKAFLRTLAVSQSCGPGVALHSLQVKESLSCFMTWPGEPAPSAVPFLALKSPVLPVPCPSPARIGSRRDLCWRFFWKHLRLKLLFSKTSKFINLFMSQVIHPHILQCPDSAMNSIAHAGLLVVS